MNAYRIRPTAGITAIMLAAATCIAAPASAADEVPHETLVDLGLGEMTVVSDSDGMQVRGRSSSALAFGASAVYALLYDMASLSTDRRTATAQHAGLNAASFVAQGPQGAAASSASLSSGPFSSESLNALANPLPPILPANFAGTAGNAANSVAAGISAAVTN